MFGAGKDGLINAPDPSRKYTLSMAEVAVFDTSYYQVLMDLTVIIDLAKVCEEMLPFIKVADNYHCLKCPLYCPLISQDSFVYTGHYPVRSYWHELITSRFKLVVLITLIIKFSSASSAC